MMSQRRVAAAEEETRKWKAEASRLREEADRVVHYLASSTEPKLREIVETARIKKRAPGLAPAVGDRIPYVMIKGAVGAKAWERALGPLVLETYLL